MFKPSFTELSISRSYRHRVVSLSVFIVGGCGPGSMKSSTTSLETDSSRGAVGAVNPAAPNSDSQSNAAKEEEKQKQRMTFKGEVDDSLASLQVKSTVLLRATIGECFGRSTSTILRTDMFAADSFLTPTERLTYEGQGKVKFVSLESPYMGLVQVSTNGSGQSARSTVAFTGAPPDVLDIEAPRLEDLSGSGRANASADSLSDRYLRSMETVGQVVAHNCNLDAPACNCNTVELATAMLSRCLPLIELDSVQFQETAKQMANQCAAGPFQTRQAIAALVGSYAFALRR